MWAELTNLLQIEDNSVPQPVSVVTAPSTTNHSNFAAGTKMIIMQTTDVFLPRYLIPPSYRLSTIKQSVSNTFLQPDPTSQKFRRPLVVITTIPTVFQGVYGESVGSFRQIPRWIDKFLPPSPLTIYLAEDPQSVVGREGFCTSPDTFTR